LIWLFVSSIILNITRNNDGVSRFKDTKESLIISVLNVHLYSISILALDLSFILFIESALDNSNQEWEHDDLEVNFIKHLQNHNDLVHETKMRVFIPENIDWSPSTFCSNFPGGNDIIPVTVLIEFILLCLSQIVCESKSKDLKQQCEYKNPANKERQKCYNRTHHSCYKLR